MTKDDNTPNDDGLLGRVIDPVDMSADDVARTVLFFASPDSEGVTAESVFVDCGYSLYGLPSPGLTRRRRRGA